MQTYEVLRVDLGSVEGQCGHGLQVAGHRRQMERSLPILKMKNTFEINKLILKLLDGSETERRSKLQAT